MSRIVNLMLALIKSEITETPLDIAAFASITEEDLKLLYALSSKHTLDHIVGYALKKNQLLTDNEISKEFQKRILLSAFQYEKMHVEIQNICKILEEEKIQYILLKGARIRRYYPEPFLRNSCDIDLLVHEKDIPKATKSIHEKLQYAVGEKDYHDISLYSKSGVHLELHFNIQENMENIDKLLKEVWSYSVPVSQDSFAYQQSNEYFFFHNIAHMAYHFVHGGCGIRTVMDVYLLREKMEYDEKTVRKFCAICGLETFYNCVLDLISVWFEEKTPTETTQLMESYILQGGVFGTTQNKLAVNQAKSKNHFHYLMQRIFLPYSSLKILYPKLEKRKWLLPFYEMCRWCRMLFKGGLKSSVLELKSSQNTDDVEKKNIQNLLTKLDLK